MGGGTVTCVAGAIGIEPTSVNQVQAGLHLRTGLVREQQLCSCRRSSRAGSGLGRSWKDP